MKRTKLISFDEGVVVLVGFGSTVEGFAAMILGGHLVELVLGHGEPATEVIRDEDAAEEGTQQVSEFGETGREDGHV